MDSTSARSGPSDPAVELGAALSGLEYEDVPEAGRRLVERCFVDTVGVGLAGATAEAGTVAADTVRSVYGTAGPASIWGHGESAPVPEATFVNATAVHALDYDDMARGMDGHPSSTLVPPILALGEAYGGSGRDLVTAYVAGFEAQCFVAAPNRKGRSGDGIHARGWHPTAVYGTFGAAGAAANLLGFDPETTRRALNVAASMAAGLKANFGSLTKPMHAGHAARSGVWAALLADHGLTSVDRALTDGFVPTYAGVADPDRSAFPALDGPLAITEEGVAIKKYPSCYLTHTTIRATAALVADHDLAAEDVSSVHVDVSTEMAELLTYDDPRTGTEAQFSIPHVVAAAIEYDHVGLAAFGAPAIDSTPLRRLRECVRYDVDPSVPRGSYAVAVTIETADGATYTRAEDTPPATTADPLPDAELERKFVDCATRTVSPEAARDAYEHLDSLRELESVDPLLQSLDG